MVFPAFPQLSVLWPLMIILVPFFYGFLLWILARLRR
jgi:hypothetical protein